MEWDKTGKVTADVARAGSRMRRRKYGNAPCEWNGHKFHSKKEMRRAKQLALLESFGEVRNIRYQVRFDLVVNGHKVCAYVADFVFEELRRKAWAPVVEDVKGVRTAVYSLKKKLMLACHGIQVREC